MPMSPRKVNPFPAKSAASLRLVRPLLLLAVLGFPAPALAVQVHGSPEGLYAHMLAHIFFASALAFLLHVLHRRPLGTGSAWRYFKLALFFFLLWNVDTFVVHWLSLRLEENAIIGGSKLWHHRLAPPLDAERWIFYLGRFDHLFCVPAMYFLVRSLRAFCAETEGRLKRLGEGA